MSYAVPRLSRLRAPRILRRSATLPSNSSSWQSVTPVATAAGGTLVLTASLSQSSGLLPLRDAEAFRAALFAVVETEMSKLTDARAVDEWHRQVLDPRIAAEVEQEVRRIEMTARQRHTVVVGDQVATRAEAAQVARLDSESEVALEQARQAVRTARARLEQRRTGTPVDMRDSAIGQVTDGELAALRAEIDSHREAIARALKSTRTESEQQLASAALAAEQAVATFERQIADQATIVAGAEADVKAAHDRYRGADPIAPPASEAGPKDSSTPQPTDKQLPIRETTLGDAA